MSSQDNYALAKFGIDEIYIHEGLSPSLLEKLHQRAVFSLDTEDNIVRKYDQIYYYVISKDPQEKLQHYHKSILYVSM